ncbi:T9SS type A sorting domain-containing protein [Winogradskyella sediminis]|uniref:T9SS type A sorting domain-containing protein n=1 Tax=Winogradskyella sediminis TaxID=1382466 RepID=UPI000E25004F|nr:T9SS type A sorting domain-containing protein [Winogradskyella sediminis]REG87880.1 putative secreted protein (Por secretion system target) [Winogradskyella sediminis]
MKQIYILFTILILFPYGKELDAQTIWTGPDLTFSKAGSVDWTLEDNQDRLTDNVWITRQNRKSIYNYKWWQDNFSVDASPEDLSYDFWNDDWDGIPSETFTATGGTKGIKWALLDDTGSTTDWTGYNYGVLGDPANFYSFNNIIQIIEILEETTGDFSTISVTDDFTVTFNEDDYASPDIGDYIVGKKFGVWLVDDDVYLTLTINTWGSGGGGGAFSYTRSTDQTLSTNDLELEKDLTLSPNPSSEFIKISNLKSKASYSVYNILGANIKSGSVSENETIDIRDLTEGVYFLKINNRNTIKFIKE